MLLSSLLFSTFVPLSSDKLEVIKMKRNIKTMLMGVAIVAATMSVSSCSTRESAINDLQNFSYELRDNSQYYTAKKWKKAVNKFGKIRRRIARHDYKIGRASCKAIALVIWQRVQKMASWIRY